MGYTHYYTISPEDVTPQQFAEFGMAVKALIDASDVPVAFESDQPDKQPMIGEGVVRFNGIGEDGHETFVVSALTPERPSADVLALANRDMSVEQRWAAYKWTDYVEADNRRREYCKTARKGYDEIVGAALIAGQVIFGDAFEFGSDGYFTDALREEFSNGGGDYRTWTEPKALYRKVFGEIPEHAVAGIIAEEAVQAAKYRERLADSV